MARIRELRFAVLEIPFKVAFRHASAERAETSSAWVESVSEEGTFGTLLLERDICNPSLMFGAGGVLNVAVYPHLEQPGFGLMV